MTTVITPPLLKAVEAIHSNINTLAQTRADIVSLIAKIQDIASQLLTLPLTATALAAVFELQKTLPQEQRTISALIKDGGTLEQAGLPTHEDVASTIPPDMPHAEPARIDKTAPFLMGILQACEHDLVEAVGSSSNTVEILDNILIKLQRFKGRVESEMDTHEL
ncbi:hypothetical protein AURDEDRAFT_171069 [Auricularia subglabra TFB-10046 SS5]|nr:hypothetical protein AURDEDRAFT_171069 [Auricularia subglabra TFB-10046 SS5]